MPDARLRRPCLQHCNDNCFHSRSTCLLHGLDPMWPIGNAAMRCDRDPAKASAFCRPGTTARFLFARSASLAGAEEFSRLPVDLSLIRRQPAPGSPAAGTA
jgi:hypothetical protein